MGFAPMTFAIQLNAVHIEFYQQQQQQHFWYLYQKYGKDTTVWKL